MNTLIYQANELIKKGGFEYAFCGGYAIDLFLGRALREHSDIDVSADWGDRDALITYMQSLGWQTFEMCGHGVAHHITDISHQIRAKRNIFCFLDGCALVELEKLEEEGMYRIDFHHTGQTRLDFIEFLFNDVAEQNFLYARNKSITRPLSKALLRREGIPFLAPELALLYKSTDIEREGYQLDYDAALVEMDGEQRQWLMRALAEMFPAGHPWIKIENESR